MYFRIFVYILSHHQHSFFLAISSMLGSFGFLRHDTQLYDKPLGIINSFHGYNQE
jgi:hypothetical protein